jgi:hypothetical protein
MIRMNMCHDTKNPPGQVTLQDYLEQKYPEEYQKEDIPLGYYVFDRIAFELQEAFDPMPRVTAFNSAEDYLKEVAEWFKRNT